MVVYKSHIYHVHLIYTILSGSLSGSLSGTKKHEYVTRLIQHSLTCNNNIQDSLCYFGHIRCDFRFAETITFIETKRKAVKLYIRAGA